MGFLYYDAAKYPEAAAYWEQLLTLANPHPMEVTILAMTGDCYRKQAEFEQALSFFELALHTSPTHFMSLYGCADCCRGLHRYREAIKYFDRILRAEPQNQSILTRAGDVCVNLGEYTEAEDYYNRALAVGEHIYARFGFVRIERRKGNDHGVLTLLEEIIKIYPGNRRVQRELAECRERLRT
ncbi:MAG: tetratricopeptide repeat protein [Spirochaetia bacterium]